MTIDKDKAVEAQAYAKELMMRNRTLDGRYWCDSRDLIGATQLRELFDENALLLSNCVNQDIEIARLKVECNRYKAAIKAMIELYIEAESHVDDLIARSIDTQRGVK